MAVSHIPITKASLTAMFTFIVGQLVAFVPSLGTDKQNLLSAGSTAIALGFIIANAVHALAGSKNPVAVVEAQLPKVAAVVEAASAPVAPAPAAPTPPVTS